jgi:electron transfer flavoprotein beta subunit
LKIGVLVKNVPDTESKVKPTPDGTAIDEQSIKWVMNPYDEFAVEEGLKIREKLGGDTTVTVLSLGPDRVVESLRTALAMGADQAVHIWDDAFAGGDSLANAQVIAAAAKPMGFDLILTGKQGIDLDAAQTAPALAEHLGFSQALVVISLELADDGASLTAKRRIEGGDEVMDVTLPAVISCEKGLNEPRYASLPGIMKAKKKEIKKLGLADVGLGAEEVGAAGAATKIVGFSPLPERPEVKMIEGEAADQARELVRALREDAKVV